MLHATALQFGGHLVNESEITVNQPLDLRAERRVAVGEFHGPFDSGPIDRADHPYESACYRPGGCADIITLVAGQIDAREFNPTFLAVFPRFVQHVTAPSSASMSATATASMIGNLATMSIVRFAVFVTASP
jgi:hypothetical protein